mmetsp:Transcript_41364/g.133375  ORF Transcript_41364/g.133375 Transcript_41364/m.133375 type:complete len:467 (-) Transcript_41364:97-1497(-)
MTAGAPAPPLTGSSEQRAKAGANGAGAAAGGEAADATLAAPQDEGTHETRNMLMLGCIFTVYFAFRSGALVVIPLCSKELLKDTVHSDFSPLYNLPLGVWFGMDVLLATPNAYLMRKHGRAVGFTIGGVAAFVGSLMAFAALRFSETPVVTFVLLNVAVMVMSDVGMAEFVRFAASEACTDPARRGKVVSRVIGFGACLSMIGPACASAVQQLNRRNGGEVLHGYSYFFLCTAGLSLVLIAASRMLRLPPMNTESVLPAAPLCTVLRRTPVWTAIVAQVAVQFAMVAPMSAVPLVMSNSIHGLHAADFRISGCIVLHVLSMFIPGFWAGNFIALLGEIPVMGIGLLIQSASLIVCLTGKSYAQFYSGLCLLGIGWNLAFVAGTMLVVSSHTIAERAKVTSANETLRFAANGVGVILASTLTWDVLCGTCLAVLAPAAAVMLQRNLRAVDGDLVALSWASLKTPLRP